MTATEHLEAFREPEGGAFAGDQTIVSPMMPYDRFMQAEGVPVHREIGFRDVRDVPLEPWARYCARGAFIQLRGTETMWGMYVIEVPPGAALPDERHLYEEFCYVVAGVGGTQVWDEATPDDRVSFEWRPGSLFAIPLNARHRILNAGSAPALLLAATTAPPVMNLFDNLDFVFGDDFAFAERFARDEKYFDWNEELLRDPVRGRAIQLTNFIPDVVNCPLPLDNQRAPGYRRMQPRMAGADFTVFIGQFETGTYSKAHYHPPGPVLVCLTGTGYTHVWPRALGATPWRDGNGHLVRRIDYVPGGMVAAVPLGEDCFHQHFGVGPDPLRFLVFGGPNRGPKVAGGAPPGQRVPISSASIDRGGRTIEYWAEDPYVREEFARMMESTGGTSMMTESMFRRPGEPSGPE